MAEQTTQAAKPVVPQTRPADAERNERRTVEGVVTRDKMDKTRRVEIHRLVKHPRYGKYVKRRTICYVHDEKNESHSGDTVEIMESRPLSKPSAGGWSGGARRPAAKRRRGQAPKPRLRRP